MRAPNFLHLLEKSPWATSLLTAAGVTLGVPSALALLLPPDLLDGAWQLGDRRLLLLVVGLFTATASIVRLLLRRPPLVEEELAEPARARPPVASGHLR